MSTVYARLRLPLWIFLGLLQIAVPASLVWNSERLMAMGTPFRFRLAPYDPADPFRGRYMNLSFSVERTPIPITGALERAEKVYGVLQNDAQGYAVIPLLTATRPSSGAYLEFGPGEWHRQYDHGTKARVELPFRRFYVNETRAAAIEEEARQILVESRKDNLPADLHAVIHVGQGQGVMVSLHGPKGELR